MSPKGIPDIIATLPPDGKSLFIEVKREGGKMSDEQVEFFQRYAAAGSLCCVVHSVKELIDFLKVHGFESAKNIAFAE